jgi:hypothetical protein
MKRNITENHTEEWQWYCARFKCQNNYNMNNSMKLLHTHPATQEKFSSVNWQNIYSCIHNSLPLDPGLSGNNPVNIPIFHILKAGSYFLIKPWNQLYNYTGQQIKKKKTVSEMNMLLIYLFASIKVEYGHKKLTWL